MRIVYTYIGPFRIPGSDHLELTPAETRTLARAAAIAERAKSHFHPDSTAWMEWATLEMHAAESAGLR